MSEENLKNLEKSIQSLVDQKHDLTKKLRKVSKKLAVEISTYNRIHLEREKG